MAIEIFTATLILFVIVFYVYLFFPSEIEPTRDNIIKLVRPSSIPSESPAFVAPLMARRIGQEKFHLFYICYLAPKTIYLIPTKKPYWFSKKTGPVITRRSDITYVYELEKGAIGEFELQKDTEQSDGNKLWKFLNSNIEITCAKADSSGSNALSKIMKSIAENTTVFLSSDEFQEKFNTPGQIKKRKESGLITSEMVVKWFLINAGIFLCARFYFVYEYPAVVFILAMIFAVSVILGTFAVAIFSAMDLGGQNTLERKSHNIPLYSGVILAQIPLGLLFISLLSIFNQNNVDQELLNTLSKDVNEVVVPVRKAKGFSENTNHYPLTTIDKDVLIILRSKSTGENIISSYQWHIPKTSRPDTVNDAEIVVLIHPGSFKHESAKWVRRLANGTQEEIGRVDLPKWDVYVWDKLSDKLFKKTFFGYLTRGEVIAYNITDQKNPDLNIGTLPFEKIRKYFGFEIDEKTKFFFPKVELNAWAIAVDVYKNTDGIYY